MQVLPTFDLVLFGGTGDLAMRKLLPAMYWRFACGQVSPESRIIGAARGELTREDYLGQVRATCETHLGEDFKEETWHGFAELVRRVPQAERAAIEAELAERSRDTAAPAAVSPVQEADTGPAGGAPATVRREPVAPAAPLPVLDDALVVRALKAFGALETVEQIVAVRGGELMSSSGEGIDPTQLPGLALATSRLLGKNGALRVFALERAAGAVFLFPLTGGGLVVLTKPKVNVGAVLAARATLEEAA